MHQIHTTTAGTKHSMKCALLAAYRLSSDKISGHHPGMTKKNKTVLMLNIILINIFFLFYLFFYKLQQQRHKKKKKKKVLLFLIINECKQLSGGSSRRGVHWETIQLEKLVLNCSLLSCSQLGRRSPDDS